MQVDNSIASSTDEVGEASQFRSLSSRVHLFRLKVFGAVRLVLARWTFRRATLVGKRTRARGRLRIFNRGTITIGESVHIRSTPVRSELVCFEGAELEIGNSTFINYGTSICATQSIRIGQKCSIGNHCIVLDNHFHSLEPERRSTMPPSAPVVLGNNVWLGVRVTVLPGVRIGDGAVIGAGSVVTKDIPARTLALGVPARVIREL